MKHFRKSLSCVRNRLDIQLIALTLIFARYEYPRAFLVQADLVHRSDLESVIVEADTLEFHVRSCHLARLERLLVDRTAVLLHANDLVLETVAVLEVRGYRLPVQIYVPINVVLGNLEAADVGSRWTTWHCGGTPGEGR